MIEKVLPAIKSKWPGNRIERSKTIFIQQDNARPHILPNDSEFVQHATKDEFDIRLFCQPPNSPDMNILDLGYFRAIQSAYYSTNPSTIDDIIKCVTQSFNDMPRDTLNKLFLSLQDCMIETIKVNGGNNYKQPHMAKDRQINNDTLPVSLEVKAEVLANALSVLNK